MKTAKIIDFYRTAYLHQLRSRLDQFIKACDWNVRYGLTDSESSIAG